MEFIVMGTEIIFSAININSTMMGEEEDEPWKEHPVYLFNNESENQIKPKGVKIRGM